LLKTEFTLLHQKVMPKRLLMSKF